MPGPHRNFIQLSGVTFSLPPQEDQPKKICAVGSFLAISNVRKFARSRMQRGTGSAVCVNGATLSHSIVCVITQSQ